MTKARITVPIIYSGRYCDEGACRMWEHSDSHIDPHCAAFGSLKRTKGDLDRTPARWPKSIRDPECVKQAERGGSDA